ncbi:hypothetical protein R3P38DRAFT_2703609 [Favolaschia claudopus]|uniref:Uncharacterized protein n=1 Tax=Favolaschia claudopus TaxID=2862362 RepID=A0AAW0BTL9_9AGAR
MPIIFRPATHLAESRTVLPATASQILQKSCPDQFEQVQQIAQYSIGGRTGSKNTLFKVVPNQNGFVYTVMNAYSFHHALVIRPDDVWIAIVSQFSFYVHANADRLRAVFVADEGKKDLEFSVGSWPPNCGKLCTCISEHLQQNILDADLRDWILPRFSTTTSTDTTISSLLMLATTKKYFEYKMTFFCGIPQVTLEGERADWELLLRRVEKLKEYGLAAIAWYHLLIPILSRFVNAFDDPDAIDNHDFWQKVARRESFGSHGAYCSGWITAFCVFTPEGKWQGPAIDMDRTCLTEPETLSSREFWSTYGIDTRESKYTPLTLDDSPYSRIDCEDIPSGCAELDITITMSADDDKTSIPCTILAGLVGTGFSSSRNRAVSESGRNDTVRPVLAWWLYSTVQEGTGGESANVGQNGGTCTSLAPPGAASKDVASKIEENGDVRIPMKRNHGSKSLLRRVLKG